ncbi:hypothetical protein AAE478_000874 [Parahypoxylon ruwenzoriense]
MERQPEVEILIHIGAPSRVADDTWYRSLAASYRDFEPTRCVSPSQRSSGDGRRYNELEGQGTQHVSMSPRSSAPFGSLKSPQASFQSVIDNAGSPRIIARGTPETDSTNVEGGLIPAATQSSWQTPSSLVEDSYIGNPINVTTLSTPTRVLEHYLQRFDSPSESSDITSQRTSDNASRSNPTQSSNHPSARDRPLATAVPITPAVVPCTPQCDPSPDLGGSFGCKSTKDQYERLTQYQPQSLKPQDEVPGDNVIEETILIESSNPSSGIRADSEPPPTKRQRLEPAGTSPRALLRTASDIGPRSSSNQRSIVTITFLSVHGYTYDSLELYAPPPPTSMAVLDPDSIITPGLEKLARDLNIPKRYRPKEEKRELRSFERGYWLVDCSDWDIQLKRDAWAYLANYIGVGVAGWGIWCKRDPEFRSFRVYCWGAVTAHIYLLLYLASQRKILFTGCSWVDGEGVAVIVIEARSLH